MTSDSAESVIATPIPNETASETAPETIDEPVEAFVPLSAYISFDGATMEEASADGMRVAPRGDAHPLEMALIDNEWTVKTGALNETHSDFMSIYLTKEEMSGIELMAIERNQGEL